jgi:hypothetical protein
MSDLLVASYPPPSKPRALRLFDRVCESVERFKGMRISDRAEIDGVLVARFASGRSPAPSIRRSPGEESLVAAAGWCQVARSRRPGEPVLDVLAAVCARGGSTDEVFGCLEGQYAAVYAHAGTRRVLAWVDRLGMLPTYACTIEGIGWFSTSAIALASVFHPRLDLHSVGTLFLGGSPKSPRSLFEGIQRLGFGQHVELMDGKHRIETTWLPYRSPVPYRGLEEAIDEGVSRIRSCCEGIRSAFQLPIMDLTSGLDSRLVVAGMHKGDGDKLSITVSGESDNVDVRISKLAAQVFGWDMLAFPPPEQWGSQRWPLFQQGVALSEGELTGDRVDHVLRVKHAIQGTGGVAVTGGGGEFFKIGRTSEIDIPRLIRYRFDYGGDQGLPMLRGESHADFLASEVATIRGIADLEPAALNTAKLDAIYIWKSGGHFGRFGGATMPIVLAISPLITQDLVEYAISLPWRYRVGGRLVRELITRMSPRLAKLPTCYGSSAEPLSILRPWQLWMHGSDSGKALVRKLSHVTVGRRLVRLPSASSRDPIPDVELASVLEKEGMLRPDNLKSAGLYDPEMLTGFLEAVARPGFTHHRRLQVLASVELVCRMSGITPGSDTRP